MGVEVRLENGLMGVIRNKDISSSETIEDPTTRMAIDQVITGRIINIDYERFKGMFLSVVLRPFLRVDLEVTVLAHVSAYG